MRTLTIKREKSFVGSLATMKVYLEDQLSPELTLNGIPCRKLGTLKNGEEQSFLIADNAARLLVAADKISASYTSTCIQLPEGTENLQYTGKNRFNLLRGNPFRFDGAEEIQSDHKKMNVTGLYVLIAAILVGALLGYRLVSAAFSKEEDKVFQKDGIQITLTDAFSESDETGDFLYAFGSKKAAVLISREDYAEAEDFPLEEYAELLAESAPVTPKPEVQKENGLIYLQYTVEVEGKNTCYFVPVYQTKGAFWIVNFACRDVLYEKLRPSFEKWASSVTFP